MTAVSAVGWIRATRIREAWLTAGALVTVTVVGLVARWLAAEAIPFPRPEDTAYYVGVGRNLVEGRGLVSDAIWSYQTPPLAFPRPAFEVWLPLPSLIAAIPMALLARGSTAMSDWMRAGQVMSVALGVLVALLAWRLGADVAAERGLPPGRARVLALGTGLTASVYLPLLLHSALPDSTMPFALLGLGACLLMARLLREPRGARITDGRLLALGLALGLAALTRNEAIWLALTWAGLVAVAGGLDRAAKLRLIAGAAVPALVVFAPWAFRDWLVFGGPFPGQALSNALSVTGTDIFAWSDRPTLAHYLAQGPAALLGARVDGLAHNLLDVLLYLGVPVSVLGLVALPWTARGATLRPLLVFGVLAFLVTSLVFPISTQWGTFLHAAGPIHVLLIVSCLLALDAGIVALGRRRGWTRPVAWLGPAFAIAGSILFSAVLLPAFGGSSRDVERRYAALGPAMAAAGLPLGASGPVITDYPIWLAETARVDTLALPDEPPSSVLALARAFPGTRTVVTFGGLGHTWSDAMAAGGSDGACFEPVPLPAPPDPADAAALEGARVWRIVCP